jgi:adenine deaminase
MNVKDMILHKSAYIERIAFTVAQTTSAYLKTPDESQTLMKVALGQNKADLAVINARIANVYTGEFIDNCAISIKGKWIAYVGPNPDDTIGPGTEVIDAGGQTVIPGLIDGHTHLAGWSKIDEFLKHAAKGGTTTIVTETLEAFLVAGYEGLVDLLESFSKENLQKLLERDDVIGLGESYWQAVLQEPDWLLTIFEQTLRAGKTLEGHSAGASEKKLAAYIANGISSCHEPIDLRRLILVSDSIAPADLMANGYMEALVQKAIDYGFEPINAIQMTTLNVAEHFSLDHLIGGIAPGRLADLVIIPDDATIAAQVVVSNGRVIAQNGNLLVDPRSHSFSADSLKSVKLPRELTPSDFVIRAPENVENMKVRVVNMVTDLVTAEIEERLPVRDGKISVDLNNGIVKIAAIDRTHTPGRLFTGLIKGFGLKAGAIACSNGWDSSDIVVAGTDDGDMATAVNRIHRLQGGVAICKDRKILAELPLPLFGIISDLAMEDLVQQFEKVTIAARQQGIPFPDPILTLTTLTSSAIPYLRICEEGLVNLKSGENVTLLVD